MASQIIELQVKRLTKYPLASFRELLALSVPLIFLLFSGSLMALCDRILLSRVSLASIEACVSSFFLCMLFQLPCMRITSTAQVFVGQYNGIRNYKHIGEFVWQMIWFSLFSMFFTYPLSFFAESIYFSGTEIESQGSLYFRILMRVNFLFPLGAALAAFFVGQGKMRVLTFTTISCHLIHILLDLLLIFGIEGLIPALGVVGAALATCISQSLYCFILLLSFLSRLNRLYYGTGNWKLKWKPFWQSIRIAAPRAIARTNTLLVWVATSRIMALKGGNYLVVMTVGSTVFVFLSFIREGMGQAFITIASNLIGLRDRERIRKLLRSGAIFIIYIMIVLSLPFIFFPRQTIAIFFHNIVPSIELMDALCKAFFWLWCFALSDSFLLMMIGLLTAAGDTKIQMLVTPLFWITSYIPILILVYHMNFPPYTLWVTLSFETVCVVLYYYYRTQKESWKHRIFNPIFE